MALSTWAMPPLRFVPSQLSRVIGAAHFLIGQMKKIHFGG
jgi:hypothetical protein